MKVVCRTTQAALSERPALQLTHHAQMRMHSRRYDAEAIACVMEFGRKVRTRGAIIYVIGHREVMNWAKQGEDLSELEGLQVVCDANGVVLTMYRNRDFSGLKDRRRGCRRSWRAYIEGQKRWSGCDRRSWRMYGQRAFGGFYD